MKQKTIKKIFIINGKTLYSNKNINIKFFPLKSFSGIYINNNLIHIKNINFTNKYYTQIGGIKLTEHLLSALYYLGINNLYIELEGDEIPIFDGSSKYFVKVFKNNIVELDEEQEKFIIEKNLEFSVLEKEHKVLNHKESKRIIKISKGDFKIKCLTEFPYSRIQEFTLKNIGDYEKEIAEYKTHMNKEYFNYCINELNLKGYTENNIFIYDKDTKFLGTELVRHKILDIIGDLALLNIRIIGNIDSFKSGHFLHQKLSQKIYEEYIKYKKCNTNIEQININEVLLLIDKYDLKPYFNLNHFSFDLSLYNKIFKIEENNIIYIFPEKPFDHWSPLYVLSNKKDDNNYLPFYIKQIKNCILYKIDNGIRNINSKVRYYWKSNCDLDIFLKFRDTISKRKHFPSTKSYIKYQDLYFDYKLFIEDFDKNIFYKYYNLLKRKEHKEAKNIPIPNIESKFIKLALLKYKNEIIFIAPIVDCNKSVSVLNLASKLDTLKNNLGIGFLGCFKLYEYYCSLGYDSFDLCISKMYGCYKNKLCIERYQFNEIIDY